MGKVIKGGRISLMTITIGAVLCLIFNFVYPDVPLQDAIETIFVISLVSAVCIEYFWTRSKKRRAS